MKYKILIVDDDIELVKMLSSYFIVKGYQVITAKDGIEAIEKSEQHPDLILLDINMPRLDGIEFCKKIRDKIDCPIIFLTAKVEEQDKINGLLSGGDDYVVKPFSLKELEARMIAHLKREERQKHKSKYKFKNGLMIDYGEKSVQIGSECVDLTNMEYSIVEFLSMNPGQVFDKERIYEKVCGYTGDGESRVITEMIRRIRNKLAAYSEEEYIETVWGTGYKWKK